MVLLVEMGGRSLNTDNKISNHNSIDLFKFIMAFVVVAIHTAPLVVCENEIITKAYYFLIELAVPFFFLSTGYLLGLKMDYPFKEDKDSNVIRKRALRILRMYISWMLIYTPLAVFGFLIEGRTVRYSIYLYLRGFFFLGEQYNSWQLWYLLVMFYALVVIYFLIRKKISHKGLLIIAAIFSFLSILLDYFMNIDIDLLPSSLFRIRDVFEHTIVYGRFFSGLVYIPVGICISCRKIPKIINWGLFVSSFILNYIFEGRFITGYLVIFASVGLFGIIEAIKLKDRPVYSTLRMSSTVIYFIHMYVWTLYYFLVYHQRMLGPDSFIVTSLLSLLISMLYICIKKRFRKSLV